MNGTTSASWNWSVLTVNVAFRAPCVVFAGVNTSQTCEVPPAEYESRVFVSHTTEEPLPEHWTASEKPSDDAAARAPSSTAHASTEISPPSNPSPLLSTVKCTFTS
ncbi:hypothetical protein DIPPA_17249 [Diplonema papillatum]|nr:hypothetical protein DIPPA_17249 [Diplonema papillatum]